jgi:hypothetical protein
MMATAPVAEATATTTEATTTTAPVPSSSGLELSPEPVYQERQIDVSETPVNQTHFQITTSGNGTLTLPNTTETISTTSTGSVIISMDGTAIGKEVISTEDGSESATAKFFGIARFDMEEDDTDRGIIIALVDTNSTGRLAQFDGMILAGQIEFPPEEISLITLWEWHSGIPSSPTTTVEEPPLMDTTTTNATTTDAAETNAAISAAPEEEVGAEGDEQQQPQQTTPTVPPTPSPNPLFE